MNKGCQLAEQHSIALNQQYIQICLHAIFIIVRALRCAIVKPIIYNEKITIIRYAKKGLMTIFANWKHDKHT